MFHESLKKQYFMKYSERKISQCILPLIFLKTYAHYLRHRFINQKSDVTTGIHIFIKIKNTGRWNKKNIF